MQLRKILYYSTHPPGWRLLTHLGILWSWCLPAFCGLVSHAVIEARLYWNTRVRQKKNSSVFCWINREMGSIHNILFPFLVLQERYIWIAHITLNPHPLLPIDHSRVSIGIWSTSNWVILSPSYFPYTVWHYKVSKAVTLKYAMWLENYMLMASLSYLALWLGAWSE